MSNTDPPNTALEKAGNGEIIYMYNRGIDFACTIVQLEFTHIIMSKTKLDNVFADFKDQNIMENFDIFMGSIICCPFIKILII